MKRTLSFIFFFSFLLIEGFAQNILKPPHFISSKVDASEISIDGKIDEKVWNEVEWSSDFIDIQGVDFPKPYQQTKMKILWSDSLLFIAAYLEEKHIWAHIEEDEKIMYYDNDFEVFIDVNRDHHQYVEFEFNALNKKWDLYLDRPYRDTVKPDMAWNCQGLKHETHIYGSLNNPEGKPDSAWTLEIAIPIHQLTEQLKAGDVWNVNFSRVQWETTVENGKYIKKKLPEDNWVWSPTWQINIHRPEYWGQCHFVEEQNPEVASTVNIYGVTEGVDPQNKWYNMCVTTQSGSWQIYVNGVLQNLTRSSYWQGNIFGYGEDISSKTNVTIGALRRGSQVIGVFQGSIVHTSLHNRLLSSDEILQNYNALKGRFGL